MKKKLIVFGVGSLAKMMDFYFSRDSDYEVVAFTVDAEYNTKSKFLDKEDIDFENIVSDYPPQKFEMFIAIGPSKMNTIRERKYREAKEKGYQLANYISPNAICDSHVGENTIIADYAIIHPFVKIGINNIFWEQCLIGNDSVVGNHCWISPKVVVSTFAEICDNSVLGTGALIKTRVTIARKSLIGASSYISVNTLENGVYGEKSTPYYASISEKVNISL